MNCTVLTSISDLVALEPEWMALHRRSTRTSPFQSPAWLIPWAQVFAPNAALRVLTVRDGAHLVAVLPLLVRDNPRRAELLGAGITDYLDVLLDESLPRLEGALRPMLTACIRDLEFLELHDVPQDSPLFAIVEHAGRPEAHLPCVELPKSFSDYLQGVPHWLRRNVHQGNARLGLLGAVSWHVADEPNAIEMLDALFALHGREWQSRGKPGVLADASVQAFHKAAAGRLVVSGSLRLHALKLNGRYVGVLYLLKHDRTAYQYLSGTDPDLRRCNLGSVLIAHAIEEAIHDGLSRYDFLRGRERYKYAWLARNRSSLRCRVSGGARERSAA